MSGGPIFPNSVYLGGASGNLSAMYYIPATNTNNAGAMEGIGVVASLASTVAAVLQYNMPESIPSGTLKIRCLAQSTTTTTTQIAKVTLSDGVTSAGSNPGATGLTSETQISQTWTSSDVLVENKVTLASAPSANQILTVVATFNASGWTLASPSVWQFTAVWE